MLIQRILQLLVIALVVLVAISLVTFLLNVGKVVLALALKVLLLLLIVAAVLRFFEHLRNRS